MFRSVGERVVVGTAWCRRKRLECRLTDAAAGTDDAPLGSATVAQCTFLGTITKLGHRRKSDIMKR